MAIKTAAAVQDTEELGLADAAAEQDQTAHSHNLVGQRIGRKGRETRERILAATAHLLTSQTETVFSLSAVAREASLAMTTLYIYFGDLSELLMAALERVMMSAEDTYLARLRDHWADGDLAAHCLAFVREYHVFWQRHTRMLHLRNRLADANDMRMRHYRIQTTQPVMQLLVRQMGGDPADRSSRISNMAAVLMTSIERMITVSTDAYFMQLQIEDPIVHVNNLLRAEAKLLEIAIRHCRQGALQSLDDHLSSR